MAGLHHVAVIRRYFLDLFEEMCVKVYRVSYILLCIGPYFRACVQHALYLGMVLDSEVHYQFICFMYEYHFSIAVNNKLERLWLASTTRARRRRR